MSGFTDDDAAVWLRMVEAARFTPSADTAQNRIGFADDILTALALRRGGYLQRSTADIIKDANEQHGIAAAWNQDVPIGTRVFLFPDTHSEIVAVVRSAATVHITNGQATVKMGLSRGPSADKGIFVDGEVLGDFNVSNLSLSRKPT